METNVNAVYCMFDFLKYKNYHDERDMLMLKYTS